MTHIHPDHYGLAGRVREASGAWVGLHPADAALLKAATTTPTSLVERMQAAPGRVGGARGQAPDLAYASMEIRSLVIVAEPDVLFEDDQKLELPGWDFRAVWTPGHSPGHICLYSATTTGSCSPATTSSPASPRTSRSTANRTPTRSATTSTRWPMRALRPRRGPPGATSTASPDLEARLDEIERHHADRLDDIERALRRPSGQSRPGTSPSASSGRGPWDEIPATCSGRPTARPWPTSCCSRPGDGSAGRPSVPARFYLAEGA